MPQHFALLSFSFIADAAAKAPAAANRPYFVLEESECCCWEAMADAARIEDDWAWARDAADRKARFPIDVAMMLTVD